MAQAHYLFGLHAVEAALTQTPAPVQELWVDQGRRDPRLARILELAAAAAIPLRRVDRQTLFELAGSDKHQGVVARSRQPALHDEDFLDHLLADLDQPPLLLVLDGVQDPHNLGACLRSADAAGVQALITPKDRAAALTPAAIKVASGAAQTVPLVQVTNLARTLKALQQAGVWLVGLDGQAEHTLYQTDLTGPLALVLGAEGQGLRRLTKEHCDFLVKIPMRGSVESLNVSVATGVCLFEALRQRGIPAAEE